MDQKIARGNLTGITKMENPDAGVISFALVDWKPFTSARGNPSLTGNVASNRKLINARSVHPIVKEQVMATWPIWVQVAGIITFAVETGTNSSRWLARTDGCLMVKSASIRLNIAARLIKKVPSTWILITLTRQSSGSLRSLIIRKHTLSAVGSMLDRLQQPDSLQQLKEIIAKGITDSLSSTELDVVNITSASADRGRISNVRAMLFSTDKFASIRISIFARNRSRIAKGRRMESIQIGCPVAGIISSVWAKYKRI